jgi:hypothetical protein
MLLSSEQEPIEVLELPLVRAAPALYPKAVLLVPEVMAVAALNPTALLNGVAPQV